MQQLQRPFWAGLDHDRWMWLMLVRQLLCPSLADLDHVLWKWQQVRHLSSVVLGCGL